MLCHSYVDPTDTIQSTNSNGQTVDKEVSPVFTGDCECKVVCIFSRPTLPDEDRLTVGDSPYISNLTHWVSTYFDFFQGEHENMRLTRVGIPVHRRIVCEID